MEFKQYLEEFVLQMNYRIVRLSLKIFTVRMKMLRVFLNIILKGNLLTPLPAVMYAKIEFHNVIDNQLMAKFQRNEKSTDTNV